MRVTIPVSVITKEKCNAPDQKTIYMIAASEMGEAVVTTEAGQEVFNELKDTVMYQLQQLQGVENND